MYPYRITSTCTRACQYCFRGQSCVGVPTGKVVYACSAQFVNLRNFEIAPHKLPNYATLYTAQSIAQFVNYQPVKQVITAFSNGARECLLSALEGGYGRKNLQGRHLCELGLKAYYMKTWFNIAKSLLHNLSSALAPYCFNCSIVLESQVPLSSLASYASKQALEWPH